MIKLTMKRRFYWPHLSANETLTERKYMAFECAAQLKEALMPTSVQLADELCALFAQVRYAEL